MVRRAFEESATGRFTKEQLIKQVGIWGFTNSFSTNDDVQPTNNGYYNDAASAKVAVNGLTCSGSTPLAIRIGQASGQTTLIAAVTGPAPSRAARSRRPRQRGDHVERPATVERQRAVWAAVLGGLTHPPSLQRCVSRA